eukprot:4495999-Alexandrium_andersonii.AAC.1
MRERERGILEGQANKQTAIPKQAGAPTRWQTARANKQDSSTTSTHAHAATHDDHTHTHTHMF